MHGPLMGRTWVLFIKNLVVLWRNGLWTLPPIIVPTCVGVIYLIYAYQHL
ncbi:hypothetical protein Y032_0782g2318, partial [Ancylostoma ceylanicum]